MARKPIRVSRSSFYPYPPDQVWTALTDPRAIAEWLMPNDFQPVEGRAFRFEVDPMPFSSGVTECRVLELDPPRLMRWEWTMVPKSANRPRIPTEITWRLEPESHGTRLHFEHVGLESLPFIARLMMTMGWGTMVNRWIPKVVANVDVHDGEPSFRPGAIPLEKRCYKTKTISAAMVR